MAYVSNISYIETGAGWVCLAVVLDLFSRKVVGWATFQNMPADLVCVALRRVIQQCRPPLRLIVHSDINRKVDKKMPLNVANRGKGFNLLKGRG